MTETAHTTFADDLARVLAGYFRVSPATVRRWVSGASVPHPIMAEALLQNLHAALSTQEGE